MTDQTEADTIAQYAQQALHPESVTEGNLYVVPDGAGTVRVVDTDSYADSPRRPTADRTVSDSESFVAYLEKHGLPQTEIYANPPTSSVVAVIDSHRGSTYDAGWQKHRLTLVLQHTKSWEAWLDKNNAWFSQVDFAEFIEQRATDVADPNPGDLMALATQLYMTKSVEDESSERLSDGQTALKYKEKITTKGLGTTELPAELKLVLQPYVDGPRQYAIARFRTRLVGVELRLGYVLIRPEEIAEGVFADIVSEIRDGRDAVAATDSGRPAIRAINPVAHPIYFGKP